MRISDLIGNLVDIFSQPKQAQEPVIGGINSTAGSVCLSCET
jgi:hypothetical protein